MTTQPHIQIRDADISKYVLLPGDPARVDIIGTYLTDFQILNQNREYRIGIGTYKGKRITVCSTGIGCPSTAIAVEELVNAGATYLIRVGTCGGAWRSDIAAGSLIIATASVRDEGTTTEYIPKAFPAIADMDVTYALRESARANNVRAFTGINRTHDAFYGSDRAIKKWGEYLKEQRWEDADTPILSSEMESAALFVIASLRNVKAGAIFAVNADPEPLKARVLGQLLPVVTESNPALTQQTVDTMIRVALDAITSLG